MARRPNAVCSSCGKPVMRGQTSRPEIICHDCRRAGLAPPKYQPMPCAQCGETFQPKPKAKGRPPQQYCSLTCAAKANARVRWPALTPEQRQAREKTRALARCRTRRLRVQGTWDGITDREILERDRWMCWLCKRRIGKTFKYPHPRSASVDHVLPISLGGDDTAFNKKAAHLGCNMARGNGRPGEQMPLCFDATFTPRPRTPRPRTPRPRPCPICGELVTGKCELHQPVYINGCRRCNAPMVSQTQRLRTCEACKTCSIEGCTDRVLAKGLCPAHFHRLKRHGDVFADIPAQGDGRPGGLRLALTR